LESRRDAHIGARGGGIRDNAGASSDEASGRDGYPVSHSAVEPKKAPGTYGSVATDDGASGDEAMIADAGVVRYTHLAPEYAVIAN